MEQGQSGALWRCLSPLAADVSGGWPLRYRGTDLVARQQRLHDGAGHGAKGAGEIRGLSGEPGPRRGLDPPQGVGVWWSRLAQHEAFDHILAAYEASTPPSDASYPAVAHGNWLTANQGATTQSQATTARPVPELPVSELGEEMRRDTPSSAVEPQAPQAMLSLFLVLLLQEF